ncbi:hypothetical protein [Nocardia noduli]|uniref:hypothetical protein n=1 Tax=Nocardia noduli TaxID=2815722 RepID=UPI001C24771A|nr:hypothetical protein [Nocardia noduli]
MDLSARAEHMRRAIDKFGEAAEIVASNAENLIRRRDQAFAEGMSDLYSICLGGVGRRSAGWVDFRDQATSLIEASGGAMTNYIDDTLDHALHSALEDWDSWEVACRYRSTVQFLLDEFDGSELLASPDYDNQMMAEADANLRKQAAWVSLLSGEEPPTGIPENHWWWFLPGSSSR